MVSHEQLIDLALELGAYRAGIVAVDQIEFEPEFRKMCESNACGMYGRSWMCPPEIGEIAELIRDAQKYRWALVYQTVDALEDSYDFEGMMVAGDRINRLSFRLKEKLDAMSLQPCLHLGAGGCRVCGCCAKLENRPCRCSDKAMSSLEAYGINVSKLAPLAGMDYINGRGTVTYFGVVLIGE